MIEQMYRHDHSSKVWVLCVLYLPFSLHSPKMKIHRDDKNNHLALLLSIAQEYYLSLAPLFLKVSVHN